MKKQKFLHILCLSFVFCISACEPANEKNEKYKENLDEQQCGADINAGYICSNTKHWHKCKDPNCSLHFDEQEHTFDEGTITKEPSFVDKGTLTKKCTVCGFEIVEDIDKKECTDHVFEQVNGEDKVIWSQQPSCIQKGIGTKTCTKCGKVINVEVNKLEHDYEKDANGNYIYVIDREPTHTELGIHHKVCKKCNYIDESTYNLGHQIVKIGDPIVFSEENPLGHSLNICQTSNCNYCELSFDLKDLTAASKQTLIFPEDGGAKFYGRSIGVYFFDYTAHETPVMPEDELHKFDKNQKGDFFEFVFNLTEEQANYLNNCMLYCKAKPADYLNGQDFWARDNSMENWSQGRYIDDLPEHVETVKGETQGKFIENYRYLLYVDDEIKDFDSNIKVPVPQPDGYPFDNQGKDLPVGDFVMPYTFHLHEGVNKIKIVMAGGYKSLFYSFEFVPCSL